MGKPTVQSWRSILLVPSLETLDAFAGRGGQRTKLALIEGNVLEHSQEVYGYMCVYLRLKGIVPPSSDRTER